MGVFCSGHGVVVELLLGGKVYVVPGEKAELPVVEIQVCQHQEPFLTTLFHVNALGAGWAADAERRVDPADVLLENGRVKAAATSGNSPRRVGVPVELAYEAACFRAHEFSQPGNECPTRG